MWHDFLFCVYMFSVYMYVFMYVYYTTMCVYYIYIYIYVYYTLYVFCVYMFSQRRVILYVLVILHLFTSSSYYHYHSQFLISQMWHDIAPYRTLPYQMGRNVDLEHIINQMGCNVAYPILIKWAAMWHDIALYRTIPVNKNTPFARASALQNSSRNCSPAPDLVLWGLLSTCHLFRRSILSPQTPVPCTSCSIM